MTEKDTKKMYHGLEAIAIDLEERWITMHKDGIGERSYEMCNVRYEEVIHTIKILGGDVWRDDDGNHRVFLAGASSQNFDDYKKN